MKIAFRHILSCVGRRGKNRFLLHIFPKIISFTPKYTRMNLSARDKETKWLFEKYAKDLCSYALGFLGNAEDAEDAVQDVFMRFWENTDARFADEKAAKTYLYNSVRNACLDLLDKKPVKRHSIDQLKQEIVEEETARYDERVFDDVQRELSLMPEQTKRVITCVFSKGMKYKEVAAELNVSVNTVKTLLRKGIQHLRSRFTNYPELLFLRVKKLLFR